MRIQTENQPTVDTRYDRRPVESAAERAVKEQQKAQERPPEPPRSQGPVGQNVDLLA